MTESRARERAKQELPVTGHCAEPCATLSVGCDEKSDFHWPTTCIGAFPRFGRFRRFGSGVVLAAASAAPLEPFVTNPITTLIRSTTDALPPSTTSGQPLSVAGRFDCSQSAHPLISRTSSRREKVGAETRSNRQGNGAARRKRRTRRRRKYACPTPFESLCQARRHPLDRFGNFGQRLERAVKRRRPPAIYGPPVVSST